MLLPVRTVGVMGDARTYDRVCALCAVTSTDGMTADVAPFPRDFLGRVSTRIGNLPPAIYATLSAPAMQRDGTLRALEGPAPRPVAPPSQTGSNDERTLLIAG